MDQVEPKKEVTTEGDPTNPTTPKTEEARPMSGAPSGNKTPAIRTMKSDIDELLKNSRLTVPQMLKSSSDKSLILTENTGPSKLKKNILIIIGIMLLAGGFWYVYNKMNIMAVEQAATNKKLAPPPALFATESSRTITVDEGNRLQLFNLILDSAKEQELFGSMKRLVLKIKGTGGQERYASLADFFEFYRIIPPQNLIQFTSGPAMIFIYYGQSGTRFGIASRISDPDRAALALFSWEPSFVADFRPFLFELPFGNDISSFEDRTYRNIDWRFLKSSKTNDLGIGYSVFSASNIVLITTSKDAMESSINRMFEVK